MVAVIGPYEALPYYIHTYIHTYIHNMQSEIILYGLNCIKPRNKQLQFLTTVFIHDPSIDPLLYRGLQFVTL
jgi:hypothetical protein